MLQPARLYTCAYDAYPNSFSVLTVMAPKLGACCAAFACTLRRQARARDAADGVAAAGSFRYPVSAQGTAGILKAFMHAALHSHCEVPALWGWHVRCIFDWATLDSMVFQNCVRRFKCEYCVHRQLQFKRQCRAGRFPGYRATVHHSPSIASAAPAQRRSPMGPINERYH